MAMQMYAVLHSFVHGPHVTTSSHDLRACASRLSPSSSFPIMFLTRSEYGELLVLPPYPFSYWDRDRGVNTFSPEGRLFQGTKVALTHKIQSD